MKYYLFKVKDSTGNEYYVLNNQYISYVGFDSQRVRSILEWNAGINPDDNEYSVLAETNYIEEIHPVERYLHQLNCDSTRFTKEEAEKLIKDVCQFYRSIDKTVYKIYYPDKNCSKCWLRENNWEGKKQFKEIK